ncbi:MAG: hypothetical protein EOP50_18460 [Sphingobacteriales bacterium]|nr:MAG: hypothetical protein EOP50_18460 [Sphingobacteriales bacterium]
MDPERLSPHQNLAAMSNEQPIRLFADAHVFDGPYQGTRTFLLGLYTELAQQEGIEVYLGAQDCATLRRSFAPVAGRIHFISYQSRSRYGRLLRELPALLQEHRIDYAHFQYAAPLRKVCAYIVTTHDLLFEELKPSFHFVYRHLRRRWFRHSALQADLLTSVSGYAACSIARHYRLPVQQISIVPNAVPALPVSKEQQHAARRRLRARYGVERYLLCVSRGWISACRY